MADFHLEFCIETFCLSTCSWSTLQDGLSFEAKWGNEIELVDGTKQLHTPWVLSPVLQSAAEQSMENNNGISDIPTIQLLRREENVDDRGKYDVEDLGVIRNAGLLESSSILCCFKI